ncbi:MAG: membrane protein insertion efficiency factor YidD [Hyphomonadaceae bacterium]|nr:membrane protein insertion efficiency factor YidD [Hyphomonadaceae bacterium]
MNPVSSLLLGLIAAYRWSFSAFVGRSCRYLPTCSEYAQGAIGAFGPWAGGWMTLARLSRCQPLGGSGWDPVPAQARRAPWWAPWRLGDWRRGRREPNGCGPAGTDNALPQDGS